MKELKILRLIQITKRNKKKTVQGLFLEKNLPNLLTLQDKLNNERKTEDIVYSHDSVTFEDPNLIDLAELLFNYKTGEDKS